MIKKKCMTCGTLHPVDHATECIVCDENNWGITCDKHQKLKLKGNSSCPKCKAEKEADKKAKEARKRKAAKKKRGAGLGTGKSKKEHFKKCPKCRSPKWLNSIQQCLACGYDLISKPKKKRKKPPKPSLKPHRGGVILFLGIFSLFCACLTGIPAWLMGKNDLAEMDLGTMDPSGRTLTNAGRITGKVVSIFWITIITLKSLEEIF